MLYSNYTTSCLFPLLRSPPSPVEQLFYKKCFSLHGTSKQIKSVKLDGDAQLTIWPTAEERNIIKMWSFEIHHKFPGKQVNEPPTTL